eukprot:8705717-Karenia_brevis.AAC.1
MARSSSSYGRDGAKSFEEACFQNHESGKGWCALFCMVLIWRMWNPHFAWCYVAFVRWRPVVRRRA